MCQIAMIVLCIMGLCGSISTKGLAIGCLIAVGIQIIVRIILEILKKAKSDVDNFNI